MHMQIQYIACIRSCTSLYGKLLALGFLTELFDVVGTYDY